MGMETQADQLHLVTQNVAQTEAIGRTLGQAIQHNLVIALGGPLGAGKTALTRGIAAGLHIEAAVSSPTFTLINEYESKTVSAKLIHMDTYRLAEATPEMLGVGFEDILAEMDEDPTQGLQVLVIEWAERIAPLLPADHLTVWLEYGSHSDERRLTLQARGAQSAKVLATVAAYLAQEKERS